MAESERSVSVAVVGDFFIATTDHYRPISKTCSRRM